MAKRKETLSLVANVPGQSRYHPYEKQHIVQGKLGERTAVHMGRNGIKTHPDWRYAYGDVGLKSSDGVVFWVSRLDGLSGKPRRLPWLSRFLPTY